MLTMFTKNNNIFVKKRSFVSGVAVLLLFSNSVIFLEFTRIWEVNGVKIDHIEHYDVAIVLGGMAEYNNDLERLSIRRGGDRLWQAIHLYHFFPNHMINLIYPLYHPGFKLFPISCIANIPTTIIDGLNYTFTVVHA